VKHLTELLPPRLVVFVSAEMLFACCIRRGKKIMSGMRSLASGAGKHGIAAAVLPRRPLLPLI